MDSCNPTGYTAGSASARSTVACSASALCTRRTLQIHCITAYAIIVQTGVYPPCPATLPVTLCPTRCLLVICGVLDDGRSAGTPRPLFSLNSEFLRRGPGYAHRASEQARPVAIWSRITKTLICTAKTGVPGSPKPFAVRKHT